MVIITPRAPGAHQEPDPEAIVDYIGRYRPRQLAPEVWDAIAEVTREVVIGLAPQTRKAAYNRLWVITGYYAWARGAGLAVEVETLHPDHVERYVATAVSPKSRANVRATLSVAGRTLTRRAPWPPTPIAYPRVTIEGPYSLAEVRVLWQLPARQITAGRHQAVEAVLLLGLGAGLGSRSIQRVTGTDVRRGGDGAVEVTAHRPDRIVPVLDRYADQLEALAAAHPGLLLGSPSRLQNVISRYCTHRGVTLRLARLRTTWLVEQIDAPVPLPELLRAAGLVHPGHLVDLLRYSTLAADDLSAARLALRGRR
ncbi:MAG: hypothetical protein ACR2JF_02515 [Iamia sp.]